MQQEIAEAGAKAALPVSVVGLSVAGITLDQWVYILTIIYLVMQMFVLAKREITAMLRKRRKVKDDEES